MCVYICINAGRSVFPKLITVRSINSTGNFAVQVVKYLSDTFAVQHGLKKGEAITPVLLNSVLEHIRNIQGDQKFHIPKTACYKLFSKHIYIYILYRVSLSLEAPNYCLCIQPNSAGFSFVNTGKQVHLKYARRHFERNLVKDVHHRSVPFRNLLKSRSNACRLLSLGPIEGQSVQKCTPHNRTTQRRYTPRDSSRQRRYFGKSIPEFGETHSSVLGCERRPVSASIMSRSCFASFPVCVYKFSSHYLNNIIFL